MDDTLVTKLLTLQSTLLTSDIVFIMHDDDFPAYQIASTNLTSHNFSTSINWYGPLDARK